MEKNAPWLNEMLRDVNIMCEQHILNWAATIEHLGIPEALRGEWVTGFKNEMNKLLMDMSQDLGSRKTNMLNRVQLLKKRIAEIAPTLGRTAISYDEEKNLYESEMKLKTYLVDLEQELRKQQEYVEQLQERQNKYCVTLGKQPRQVSMNPLPSPEELDALVVHIDALEDECFKREEKFTTLQCEIQKLATELEYVPANDFEQQLLNWDNSAVLVSDRNMQLLQQFEQSLLQSAKTAKIEYDFLMQKIEQLWDSLEEPEQHRREFLAGHTTCKLSTLNALKQEVKRLDELKNTNLEILVKRLRQRLIALWDKYHYTKDQREDFLCFDNGVYTENIFSLFQNEILKINRHYEENKDLFEKLVRLEECWKRLNELDTPLSGADRLKNRGGHLLQEEKERKATKKRIEKLEQQITKLAEDYARISNTPFLFKGIPAEDFIKTFYENKEVPEVKPGKALVPNKSAESSIKSTTLPTSKSQAKMQRSAKKNDTNRPVKSTEKVTDLDHRFDKITQRRKVFRNNSVVPQLEKKANMFMKANSVACDGEFVTISLKYCQSKLD